MQQVLIQNRDYYSCPCLLLNELDDLDAVLRGGEVSRTQIVIVADSLCGVTSGKEYISCFFVFASFRQFHRVQGLDFFVCSSCCRSSPLPDREMYGRRANAGRLSLRGESMSV